MRDLWNTRFKERPTRQHVGLYAFKLVLLGRNWGQDYRERNHKIQKPNEDLRDALEGYEATPLTREIREDEGLIHATTHAINCRKFIIETVILRLSKEAHATFCERLELR